MTWMPLPPPDRLLPRSESSDVSHFRWPDEQGRRTNEKRETQRGPGLWVMVGLFLMVLLLFLLAPRSG